MVLDDRAGAGDADVADVVIVGTALSGLIAGAILTRQACRSLGAIFFIHFALNCLELA